MGDCGNLHTEKRGNIADAKLGFVEDVKNFDARAVTENLVEIGKREELGLARQNFACVLHALGMMVRLLTIGCNFFQSYLSFQYLNSCSSVLYNTFLDLSIGIFVFKNKKREVEGMFLIRIKKQTEINLSAF